jgi:hypothetical protein
MPGRPIQDRRWEWDRRSFEDRRRASERRGDLNLRAFGDAVSTSQDTIRAYVFRSFCDRRRRDDRRTLPIADRRAHTDPREDDRTVDLSPEEILALLHQPKV